MRFETYQEAEQWVLNRKSILVYFEPFLEAMHALQDPQNGLSYIHVAGTNGKGSTCRFLYDIARPSFKQVGMYTSPHLENIRDRIRINDEWIPEEVFLRYVNEHIDVIDTYNLGMVGICSMMCFLWFQERKVDLAILEVSLGGRYDTTNVIEAPLVTVITSIGFDHMEFFGNTLKEIAYEKDGILKPGVPVVLGPLKEEAYAEITERALEKHAEVIELPSSFAIVDEGIQLEGDFYRMAVSADYLKQNAALALLAAKQAGIAIHSEAVHEALMHSLWPGRFETVSEKPRIILDGAHNPDGIEALCREIEKLPSPHIVVFSALKDKQGPLMREMLEAVFDVVITTEFSHYRADQAAHLGGGNTIPDWKEAIAKAVSLAGENGTAVITGSLYFIASVRTYLKEEPKQD